MSLQERFYEFVIYLFLGLQPMFSEVITIVFVLIARVLSVCNNAFSDFTRKVSVLIEVVKFRSEVLRVNYKNF